MTYEELQPFVNVNWKIDTPSLQTSGRPCYVLNVAWRGDNPMTCCIRYLDGSTEVVNANTVKPLNKMKKVDLIIPKKEEEVTR